MITMADLAYSNFAVGACDTHNLRNIYLLKDDGTYLSVARIDSKVNNQTIMNIRTAIVTGCPCYSAHTENFVKRSRNVWIQGSPCFALAAGFRAKRNVQLLLCHRITVLISGGVLKEF